MLLTSARQDGGVTSSTEILEDTTGPISGEVSVATATASAKLSPAVAAASCHTICVVAYDDNLPIPLQYFHDDIPVKRTERQSNDYEVARLSIIDYSETTETDTTFFNYLRLFTRLCLDCATFMYNPRLIVPMLCHLTLCGFLWEH